MFKAYNYALVFCGRKRSCSIITVDVVRHGCIRMPTTSMKTQAVAALAQKSFAHVIVLYFVLFRYLCTFLQEQ